MSGSSWPAGGWPEPRIGDAEREGAVWALGEHYAVGRLSQEEHDERTSAAWQARTHSELAPLFRDLPQPHGRPAPPAWATSQPPRRPPGRTGRRRVPWTLVLVALLVAAVVLGAPVPVVVVLAVVLALSHGHLGGCGAQRRGSGRSHQR